MKNAQIDRGAVPETIIQAERVIRVVEVWNFRAYTWSIYRGEQQPDTQCTLSETLSKAERQCLLNALCECGGNRTKAAELLGISRKNLWEKLKAHHID